MKILLKRILYAFAAMLLLLSLVAAYAYFIEPSRLIIKETTIAVPNWSAKLNGFKVVAISDIHGGSNNVTEERLRELVRKANEQNPDLIVLLGDYISERGFDKKELRMPIETIAVNLRGLRAKHGVYGVIGNHDWWHDEPKIAAAFEQAGIDILENEIAPLEIGDETVYLWGIEDFWKKRRVPTAPFDALPEKRNVVAITHNPDSLAPTPAGIAVLLAGHSHGGQVRIPFYGAMAFVNDPRFVAGLVTADDKKVFVTSGVGCSGPPIRFLVPPEIAVLTLSAE